MNNCHICNSSTRSFDSNINGVVYYYCDNCHYIRKDSLLDYVSESKEYLRHNNDITNVSYVNYFKKYIDNHFINYLNGEIIDYGSGPYPILKEILSRDYNITIDIFDPFYNNDLSYKDKTYDVVLSTEVIEHVFDVDKYLSDIISITKAGSTIILMTLLHDNDLDKFKNWWYQRDVTHIGFFDYQTFTYLAYKYNLEIIDCDDERVIIFKRLR